MTYTPGMTRTRVSLVAWGALVVLGGPMAAQPALVPAAAGFSPQRLGDVTRLLEQFVADRKIAGAVAGVARNGQLAYLEAVGVQDLDTRAPMTERSLFRIYSMTKPVAAVAAMMLHEEGRFQLSDPAAAYLPAFERVTVLSPPGGPERPPASPITVRDLLLHTSGLSHRSAESYQQASVRLRTDTLERFVDKIAGVPLMEDPGTRYRYSEGTTVIGRLVEVWSGQPFDQFVERRILEPLGMTDTGFSVRPDQRPHFTTVYRAVPDEGLTPFEIEPVVPFTERPALIEGAVGLVSTVPDYLRFSQMLANGGELDGVRLLRADTVASMVGNGLSDRVLAARRGPMGWGLANVNVLMNAEGLSYPARAGEYGWDGSAGTIFWVDPADRLITVLMWQRQPANPDGLRERVKTLVHQARVD